MPRKPYEGLPTETSLPAALADGDDTWVDPIALPLEPGAPDLQAARTMKARARTEAEIVQLVKRHQAAVQELDDWLKAETDYLKDRLDAADTQLQAWHRRAHAEGRAVLKVSFPYGTSQLGPEPRASLDITDPAALVEWCDINLPDVVQTKVTRTVPKDEFKKLVSPPKGDASPVMPAVTADGEKVPGAQFLIPERSWKVTR